MSKINDLTRVLTELRGGLVALNAAQQMEEVIRAVQESGKTGTVTLTLTFKPVGSGNREIHVSAKVAAKAPANPDLEERSIFFADESGQLHRNDPRQGQLYNGPQAVADGSSPAEQREHRSGTYDR